MLRVDIDHLLLAITDLDSGMEQFESLTGIQPVFGGVHPHIGTHNALVSLGEGRYLEIIAPQDPSKSIQGPFGGFDKRESLSVFGWSICANELESLQTSLENHHIKHSGSVPGSRATPDGQLLKWSTTFILTESAFGINPFFIRWENHELHPSRATPGGCTLQDFTVGRQSGEPLDRLLRELKFDQEPNYQQGAITGRLLRFGLRTPKGYITFE